MNWLKKIAEIILASILPIAFSFVLNIMQSDKREEENVLKSEILDLYREKITDILDDIQREQQRQDSVICKILIQIK